MTYLKNILVVLCCGGWLSLSGQGRDTLPYDFPIIIDLEVLEVTAEKGGFDVADFIFMVQTDTTFYHAFRNIRFLSYHSSNKISFFHKKKPQITAHYQNTIAQQSDGRCRTMRVLTEKASGDFYKKKKAYRYYTAKMLDRLFFTHGRRCESPQVGMNDVPPANKIEAYVAALKKLIFSPGEAIDVPLLGDKMAIFSKKMQPYYDYRIRSEKYQDSIDCYVFSAIVKPAYQDNPNKTVLKKLHTYFDKNTFQIVARDYRLAHSTILYDFDVTMHVSLTSVGEQYVPTHISYDGYWNIPFKKMEKARFDIRFWDFR